MVSFSCSPYRTGMCERMSATYCSALSNAACGTVYPLAFASSSACVACTVWYGSDSWNTSHQPHPPSYICRATSRCTSASTVASMSAAEGRPSVANAPSTSRSDAMAMIRDAIASVES